MSERKAQEFEDTMKFKVPKQKSSTASEQTRIYNKEELNRMRAKQSAANRQASELSRTSKQKAIQPVQQSNLPQPKNYTVQHGHKKAAPVTKAVPQPPKPIKKKKKGFFYLIKKLIFILFFIFAVYSVFALYYINKITPIKQTYQYTNDPDTLLYSTDIKNILIIGEDSRDPSVRGLSDSMILLSINSKNQKLQMTSFMRDMYTEIDGYNFDKLNAAYSYGGAELLKDTIEDNFKIRIDGCVTVNFSAVAYLVDAVGGVQITISDEEANAINEILYNEVNEIMGANPSDDFLPKGGTYLLDGKQALSYSRIRYVGDADFERTQRQRTVITQILKSAYTINPLKFHTNITKSLSFVGSDMSVLDMYLISLKAPYLMIKYKPEQMRIPVDGTWDFGETWDGQSVIEVNFASNIDYLRDNIYLQ